MNKRAAVLTAVLAAVLAFELVFVPVEGLLASPPNVPLVTCQPQTNLSEPPHCVLKADYYKGGGSITYCFLGEGALYLKGVYYPLTRPGASLAREISNHFCPAMKR